MNYSSRMPNFPDHASEPIRWQIPNNRKKKSMWPFLMLQMNLHQDISPFLAWIMHHLNILKKIKYMIHLFMQLRYQNLLKLNMLYQNLLWLSSNTWWTVLLPNHFLSKTLINGETILVPTKTLLYKSNPKIIATNFNASYWISISFKFRNFIRTWTSPSISIAIFTYLSSSWIGCRWRKVIWVG